jgi:hypothetical protein
MHRNRPVSSVEGNFSINYGFGSILPFNTPEFIEKLPLRKALNILAVLYTTPNRLTGFACPNYPLRILSGTKGSSLYVLINLHQQYRTATKLQVD